MSFVFPIRCKEPEKMKVSVRMLVSVMLAVAVGYVTQVQAGDQIAAATILTPQQGDAVLAIGDLTIKTSEPGEPVVLVRAELDNMWWVQQSPEPMGDGFFSSRARFGNAKTADGTKFRITVLMPKSAEQAKPFEVGAALKELPSDAPRSAEVQVILQRSPRLASSPDILLQPEQNQEVKQIQEVVGKIAPDSQAILLVRSSDPNEPWWVQPPIEMGAEGRFTTNARFGNDQTPPGSRFKLMVIMPKDAQQAEAYQPGDAIKALPPGIGCSKEVEVVLGSTE